MQAVGEPIDSRLFRDAMGCFATGVCILTVSLGSELHGMTLNSLTSVSLHPPLILVCLANGSRTERAVRVRGSFAINILRYEQLELSRRFARPGEDHFAGLEIFWDEHNLPLIPGYLACLVCRVARIYPEGDHQIVVAEVAKVMRSSGQPLLFFQGKYCSIGPADAVGDCWYW
jgi:flavin reductase (DIM6/NTAB) family NADH-FMN oxidoreductase RutF